MILQQKRLFKAMNLLVLQVMITQSFVSPVVAFTNLHRSKNSFIFNLKVGDANDPKLSNTINLGSSIVLKKSSKIDKNLIIKPSGLKMLGGPGQPETGQFSVNSTSDLVDLFSGDFSYTIPLADIEGYPLILNYNSSIGMTTEASWVGLGWDLNVGAVSREMRGIPDEFNGEQTIVKTFNQACNIGNGKKAGPYLAAGVNVAEIFGVQAQLTALFGKYTDTYIGNGRTRDFGLQSALSIPLGETGLFVGGSFGFQYSADTKRGIGKDFNFGLSTGLGDGQVFSDKASLGVSLGRSSHSRSGLTSKNFGLNAGYDLSSGATYSATSVIPYGTRTTVPSVRMKTIGESRSVDRDFYVGVGLGAVSVRLGLIKKVFNSNDFTVLNGSKQITQSALGYFHNGKYKEYEPENSVYGTSTVIMDFNRTNDTEYSEEMKNLAFSIQTFDVFRVSAMGISATFRGRRQDIGTYKDPTNSSKTSSSAKGLIAGLVVSPTSTLIPLTFEIGKTIGSGEGNVVSGNFKNQNNANILDFNDEPKGNLFDQSVYFKGVGENTPEKIDDYNYLGGTMPGRLGAFLTNDQKDIALTNNFYIPDNGQSESLISGTINSPEEIVRAVDYRPYTAEEYSNMEPTYSTKTINDFFGANNIFPRNLTVNSNGARFKNHISAIEVVNTDGMKYTFGISAYELKSSQVTFSASCRQENVPLTNYVAGSNNSTGNPCGPSNYFDKTDIPAYPHSFLLSEMVSSDYIDRTNNGPTLDDVGSYYKFNYSRIYDDIIPYKWRFPFEEDEAFFNRGSLGTRTDDVASYVYGEKEIWYTHSVESKNLVAEFYLEDRKDAHGVKDEDGGINPEMKLKLLKYIKIFNRSDRQGKSGSTAIPLQVIEFDYSYELCKNQPSNINTGIDPTQSGKLTLKKIRSYSGQSEEMGLYSYNFAYDQVSNKNYSNDSDAWGNSRTSSLPEDVFPYAEQKQSLVDPLASNWKLKQIITPAHGSIEVDYESDTYSTVQDKRAMKHMDLVGMTNIKLLLDVQSSSTWNVGTFNSVLNDFHTDFNNTSSPNYELMDTYMRQFGRLNSHHTPNNVLVFKLDTPISSNSPNPGNELKEKWFKKGGNESGYLTELFLKLHVKVNSSTDSYSNELIPVFGKISSDLSTIKSIGVMPPSSVNSDFQYGYVIIDPSLVEDKDGENENAEEGTVFNSFQKLALEYIRRELPDIVYNSCVGCNPDFEFMNKESLDKNSDINLFMSEKKWVPTFYRDYSTVRLFVPNDIKYGGNGRVKSITYKDNWDQISGEYNSVYKWLYVYTKDSKATGNASFEPIEMIDECALYQWSSYINLFKKFPDETKFTPTPISAILFPNPMIGYSEVIVKMDNVQNKGFSTNTFYTSYDFPTLEDYTTIDKSTKTDKPSNVFIGKTSDKYGFNQGYSVITNDFHGKPKESKVFTYDQSNAPILQSRSTYNYNFPGEKIQMINRGGELTLENTAQEFDIHADSRYIENMFTYSSGKIAVKIKFAPFPVIYPSVGYSTSSRLESFYSSVIVKHLNRSAILKNIETENLGSINRAKNIAYDYHSGNVILSSLTDEYNDQLYSLNYPAHWYYKELRNISPSQGKLVSGVIDPNGTIIGMEQILTPGDVIQILGVSGQPKVWVAKNYPTNTLYLMNSDGSVSNVIPSLGIYDLKIVKSNRDNRLNENIQSLVTKKNPMPTTTSFVFPQDEIISSSAISYRDRNNIICGERKTDSLISLDFPLGSSFNPYLTGVRGDLVADDQFNWQSERSNTTHPYKTRFDGTFSAYTSFYQLNSTSGNGVWKGINETGHPSYISTDLYQKWRQMGKVTVYDVFGNPLESKDQIDIRSSVLYGYDHKLNLVPIAQAVNARQNQIAFDGFEDYSYFASISSTINNSSLHFNFKTALNSNPNASLNNLDRHSGLNSIKLVNNTSLSVTHKFSNNCDILPFDKVNPYAIKAESCTCIKPFEPQPGEYLISAWVKSTDPLLVAGGKIEVAVTGLPNQLFSPSGVVIDGWQRLEGTFVIPAITGSTNTLSVSLKHTEGSVVYFDDIRIHPLLAGMTTTVYDPKTLLPIATHDGYNFTTFYNYDENLNLVRVRVETIEGIKTISESEMGGYKQ